MTGPVWLTTEEHARLEALLDHLVPADPPTPGAGEAGGARYVDRLLGAFSVDPPRIWAGGPFSGRHGGEASFDRWLELGPVEILAWRIRIEGSRGVLEREFNGPVTGWQEIYRSGLAALGDDFVDLDAPARSARLHHQPALARLAFTHACESLYGDPIYGGNRGGAAWAAIGFAGDVQPLGWSDREVAEP